MNVKPLGNRILVEPLTPEETTASGIVLPATADKEKKAQGKILAVGNGEEIAKLGLKVGNSHEELKVVYRELKEKQVPIVGLADHGVTHSIYVTDPDGNELELLQSVENIVLLLINVRMLVVTVTQKIGME
jgi:co-chaperonin GroES (HSP10)